MKKNIKVLNSSKFNTSLSIEEVFLAAEKLSSQKGLAVQNSVFDNLHKELLKVYNQRDNTKQVESGFRRWYLLQKKKKPLSFFLVGTSGVGKTFTAEQVSKSLEAEGYSWFYADMNGYAEKHSVSNLVGSPRGYVGSTDKPAIFQELDNSKDGKLVICFDEIEKAHPDILTRLMQLLEMGHLEWSGGRGDFSNCIIFFTSNAIMEELVAFKKSFVKGGGDCSDIDFHEKIAELLIKSGKVRTEVTGRIDSFLVYNPLRGKSLLKIIHKEIIDECKNYGLICKYTQPETLIPIALKSSESTKGARTVKKMIKKISDKIIEFKLSNPNFKNIQIVFLDEIIVQSWDKTNKFKRTEIINSAYEILKQETQIEIKNPSSSKGIVPETKKSKPIKLETKEFDLPFSYPKSNPKFPADIDEYFVKAIGLIKTSNGFGSGFIISPDGYILTCKHVVENQKNIEIILEGETKSEIPSDIILHPSKDIALLKIDRKMLNYFELSDKEKSVRGEAIGFLGYPNGPKLGDNASYTHGNISSFRKVHNSTCLQIDLVSAPGASGGAVFRLSDGKIVGILAGGLTESQGFNIAIEIQNVFDLLHLTKVGMRHIKDKETGHSYFNLFSSYLELKDKVVLTEPYLFNDEQKRNLKEFCQFLIKKKVTKLTLRTNDKTKNRDTGDTQYLNLNFLKDLKKEFSKSRIQFSWQLYKTYQNPRNIHDRFLETQNWIISLGKGIHIFKWIDETDFEKLDNQEFRETVDFSITYERKLKNNE